MPDPKDHLDEDYTFVKAHVRHKKNNYSGPTPQSATILILVILAIIIFVLYHVPRVVYYVSAFLFPIIVTVYFLWRHSKRKSQMEQGDYYSISHQCPNCGVMNIFNYPHGSKATGVKVKCRNCHRNYTY